MDLEAYGWNDAWRDAFRPFVAESLTPGRVAVEHRGMYYVATGSGECAAEMAGRLRHDVLARSDLPAVGDFVALRLSEGDGPAVIRAVLPRKTAFIRKAAGDGAAGQVVAANIDTVFIMSALDRDF